MKIGTIFALCRSPFYLLFPTKANCALNWVINDVFCLFYLFISFTTKETFSFFYFLLMKVIKGKKKI